MSIPTLASNVFRRDDLAAHVQAVYNNAGFALARIAPVLPVDKQTGKLMVIKAGAGMEYLDSKRGDGAGYRRIAIDLESKDFSTKEYGIEMPIGATKAKAYGSQINMDQAGAKFTGVTAIRDIEKDSIDTMYANVTGGAAAGGAWTTVASATPALDVATQAEYIFAAHGIPLSDLTVEIPHNLAAILPFVTDVRTRLKIDSAPMPGQFTEQQLAQYFACREVVIAGSAYNTAKEGQTASIAQIAPTDKVLIFKRADGDVTQDPGYAKTVVWLDDMVPEGDVGQMSAIAGIPIVIEQYAENATRATVYRSRLHAGLFEMNLTMARKITGCA